MCFRLHQNDILGKIGENHQCNLPLDHHQYSKMTAVLLEAIKEQQVQIDELKAKLN